MLLQILVVPPHLCAFPTRHMSFEQYYRLLVLRWERRVTVHHLDLESVREVQRGGKFIDIPSMGSGMLAASAISSGFRRSAVGAGIL